MDALREHYTNPKPKAVAPVRNELAEFNRAMERHAASENAKQRQQLEIYFAKREAQRTTKTK